mmetsp:Transcript_1975/g.4201  ORF Transcript_1975/g.4201 Transcript_1975/m.4201 type:complete len:484 (-) Transcript_1975:269-1720(-)
MYFMAHTFCRYEYQRLHQYRPYPLGAVRDITRQVLEALAFLHKLQLVHTDIKPENICLVSGEDKNPGAGQAGGCSPSCSPASTEVRLIDFGTAEFCAFGKMRHALVGTRQYRAPEVLFSTGWDATLDVWAVACVVTEMLCGRQLFPAPHEGDLEHLAYVERVRGRFPRHMLRQSQSLAAEKGANQKSLAATCFDETGGVRVELLVAEELKLKGESKIAARLKRRGPLGEMFPDPKDAPLLDLLDGCLQVEPLRRLGATAALRHPFFTAARKPKQIPANQNPAPENPANQKPVDKESPRPPQQPQQEQQPPQPQQQKQQQEQQQSVTAPQNVGQSFPQPPQLPQPQPLWGAGSETKAAAASTTAAAQAFEVQEGSAAALRGQGSPANGDAQSRDGAGLGSKAKGKAASREGEVREGAKGRASSDDAEPPQAQAADLAIAPITGAPVTTTPAASLPTAAAGSAAGPRKRGGSPRDGADLRKRPKS